MTNQDDARVAEMVGYEAWEKYTDHKGNPVSDPFMVLRKPNGSIGFDRSRESLINDGYAKCSLGDWIDIANMPAHLLSFPTFTILPTYETDGIVLRWVQGQDSVLFFAWSKAYGKIVQKLNPKGTAFPRERFYKPGMYAQALLATREEERGE